jgi:cardiolipin synthase
MRQLPNLFTFIRIALTPVIVATLVSGECWTPIVLSVIASVTDAFDGAVARRYGAVTQTGAYLDPIADKFLLVSLFISFGVAQIVPAWLTWLVVGRDVLILVMVGLGMLLLGERRYPPTIWGKLSTVIQILAAVVFLSRCAIAIPEMAYSAVIWSVALATAWSGLHYTWRAVAILRSHAGGR